ncbi:MAG: alpha/beta fold hydrolase [Desulfobacteraceae bacterium]
MTTLVLLHGWAADSRIWQRQQEHFSPVADLQVPDLPLWEAAWLDDYLRPLPLSDTVLVGWSLGGMLALETVARMRNIPRALVLVGVTACFCRRPDFRLGTPPALVRTMRRRLWSEPANVVHDFAELCLAPEEKLYDQEWLSLWPRPESPEFLAQGLDYLLEQDLRPWLRRLKGEVIIVHGEQDRVAPVAQAYYLQAQIPTARLDIYQNAGHLPFLTQADRFNALLMELVNDRG